MFEQSFVGVSAKSNRGWPVVASLTLQFSLVATALLVPLVNPDILPRAVWSALPLAAPPPPPPPPAAAPVVQQMIRTVRSVMDGARMLLPRAIPPRAVMIDDGEMTAVSGDRGVDGGIPGGAQNGVIHSILEAVRTQPPPPAPVVHEAVAAPKPIPRLKTGGNVQDALIIHRVIPVYPPLARQARIEGKVVFAAVISVQGAIQALRLVSGHPLLVDAARDAVRQWRYRPSLLNGDPCEVDTVIEVHFRLNQ